MLQKWVFTNEDEFLYKKRVKSIEKKVSNSSVSRKKWNHNKREENVLVKNTSNKKRNFWKKQTS